MSRSHKIEPKPKAPHNDDEMPLGAPKKNALGSCHLAKRWFILYGIEVLWKCTTIKISSISFNIPTV